MNTILTVRQLEKSFHKQQVLKGINFELKEGEILGIVGESGCGKSTLARLISRLIALDAGEIILREKNITNAMGKERRRIYKDVQMIFQSPKESFHPRYNLGTSIMEGMRNQGISPKDAKSRMLQLLKDCGLPIEYEKRYPHEVSIGECQRAAIARALAFKPNIIICDEATSSLDVTIQKQIITLLFKLQQEEKLAYLFISHDLALVQQFCHRVLIMQDGRIVEEGIPDEIIKSPKTEYTKRLIEAVYEW